MDIKLRRQIISAFKMYGFILRSEATKYLMEVLAGVDEAHREPCLERLIEAIRKLPLEDVTIERKHCELSVAECNQEQNDDIEVLNVIDAFSIPHLTYNAESKKFQQSKVERSLMPDASEKVNLFLERYSVLHQRTLRHNLFTTVAQRNALTVSNKFQLKTIDYLLGGAHKMGDLVILGMLTQMKEGKWYLEDPTGSVCLDLKRANFHVGLFTENCFVLAEGCYDNDLFQVQALGFPPPELASATRSTFGNTNFFGGRNEVSAKENKKLKQMETDNEDAMFVLLSDVWLDNAKVMQKLRRMFDGYSYTPPTCFILCGNFLSQAYGHSQVKILRDRFKQLGELLNEFPRLLESSMFVFVPGPQDPGASPVLPNPGIPEYISKELTKKVPRAIFTSNPCRIQYCTQEIVVFREDIIVKMCRNSIKYPSDGNIPSHFVKTIVCQGHMCPLPLHVEPIHWSFDDAFRTYPLPDLVVCSDKFDPYTVVQSECCVTNPGSFLKSDFSFKVYWPSTKQVEDCKISD